MHKHAFIPDRSERGGSGRANPGIKSRKPPPTSAVGPVVTIRWRMPEFSPGATTDAVPPARCARIFFFATMARWPAHDPHSLFCFCFCGPRRRLCGAYYQVRSSRRLNKLAAKRWVDNAASRPPSIIPAARRRRQRYKRPWQLPRRRQRQAVRSRSRSPYCSFRQSNAMRLSIGFSILPRRLASDRPVPF